MSMLNRFRGWLRELRNIFRPKPKLTQEQVDALLIAHIEAHMRCLRDEN